MLMCHLGCLHVTLVDLGQPFCLLLTTCETTNSTTANLIQLILRMDYIPCFRTVRYGKNIYYIIIQFINRYIILLQRHGSCNTLIGILQMGK